MPSWRVARGPEEAPKPAGAAVNMTIVAGEFILIGGIVVAVTIWGH
jgi:hypothetical protein